MNQQSTFQTKESVLTVLSTFRAAEENPEREVLSVSLTFKWEQERSLSFTHTYCYYCPCNDGLKCARVNAKL